MLITGIERSVVSETEKFISSTEGLVHVANGIEFVSDCLSKIVRDLNTIEHGNKYQFFGARIVNDVSSGYLLCRNGYYQGCFSCVRSMIEIINLTIMFYFEKDAIDQWYKNSNQRKFRPAAVRRYISERTNIDENALRDQYRKPSRLGTHISSDGFGPIIDGGHVKVGPMFKSEHLVNCLTILCSHSSYALKRYVMLLDNCDPILMFNNIRAIQACNSFDGKLAEFHQGKTAT